MIQMLLEWIYLLGCMICMVTLGERTYHWTVRNWKKITVGIVIYIAGLLCYSLLDSPFNLLFYVCELLAWILLCNGRLRDKLFKIIALFFVVGTVSALAAIFVDAIVGAWVMAEIRNLLEIAVTFLFFYVITGRKWYRKVIAYLDSVSRLKGVLVFFTIVFGQAIVVFAVYARDLLYNQSLLMILRVLLAVELCAIIAIILWLVIEGYQKRYYLEQNSLKEEYIRTQQEYYQTIYEKDKEMRSFRHDVASQIGLLQVLLERGDVEAAKDHLSSIQGNFAKASFRKIHVGEDMLDAILSMMSQKASETGIQIEIAGKLEDHNTLDVYALCTIFSNAINNALEACDKLAGEKVIRVKIVSHNQTLYCVFENPATKEMYQSILQGETSKANKDNHGYGIRNIRHAVERLGGSMEYKFVDGKVTLEIYI